MREIVAENISVITSNGIEGRGRLDAEYYQPAYLTLQKEIALFNPLSLKYLVKSIRSFGAYSLTNEVAYVEDGIPFLRCVDIKPGYVDLSDVLKIDNDAHRLLWKSEVKPGQVLLAMSGSVGNAAVASFDWDYPINSNQDIAKITPAENIDPYFLATFLNCRYGTFQTERLPVGSVQQHIFLWQIENILVPLFQNAQESISCKARQAEQCLNESKKKYRAAVALLYEELGIKDTALSHESCYEVTSADTIAANRINAEYYQPKYERIMDTIKKHACKSIGDMFRLIKGIEPGSAAYYGEGKPFIRVSNLSKFEVNSNNQQYLSDDIFAKLKTNYQPWPGEILLSKDASPGIALHLKERIEGVISGGILRLQAVTDLKKEYVCLVINSLIGRSQIERDVGGSIINHWKSSQVKETLIPILPDKIQGKIESLCVESFAARRRAKALLEEAKQKVEDMIEKGGAT